MRLLLLNHNYRFGGTYYRAFPMAEQLARRGHQVTLLTVSPTHRLRASWSNVSGVRIGETPSWGQDNSGEGYGPFDNLLRCAHAAVHHYDIIHMFDHKPNASLAAFTGRLRGAVRVADWADWWGGPGGINEVTKRRLPIVGKFETWWEEQSKLWANGVVTISTVLAQRALDIGCPPERVIYIPTGAATDRIRPIPLAEARNQLGVPEHRRIVGFIGMGQGDLETVMSALRQLPEVWLMVVGNRNPRVAELARSFDIADRLWQTGFVSDDQVSLFLSCADLMCLPLVDRAANRGRLPNKILDYMSAGRPTVASPVGDIATIVAEHRVGLVASDDQFVDAIDKLLTDEPLRVETGQRARHVAETVFNWSHLIDRLETFYRRLMN